MEEIKKGPADKKPMVIDMGQLINIVKEGKKYFYWTLPIAFVIGAVIMWSTPKYYSCVVKLAPETSTSTNALSSLASSFGLKLGNSLTEDAIIPAFYPDVISSNDFIISLFDIQVETEDGAIKTSYYDYLTEYQQAPWWSNIGPAISSLFSSEKEDKDAMRQFNAFRLTKEQTSMVKGVREAIGCGVDKKTDVITIIVDDPDPLVSAIVADSVQQKLQEFITTYRTNKARKDLEYLEKMRDQVRVNYKEAEARLTHFIDANHDLFSAKDKAHRDDLENEFKILANSYNNLCNQIQLNQAKVQASTPVFTTLQSASVPIRPTGPHRTQTLLIILVATFLATAVFIIVKSQTANKQP